MDNNFKSEILNDIRLLSNSLMQYTVPGVVIVPYCKNFLVNWQLACEPTFAGYWEL